MAEFDVYVSVTEREAVYQDLIKMSSVESGEYIKHTTGASLLVIKHKV